MGSFGERLQREREMRSITLEEIADSTKISCRFLRALETEDFGKLPGGIFNKGFVRAYAKFLGIDEEQAVADFVAAEAGALKPEKFPVVDPNQPSLFTSSNGHKDSAPNIYAAAASRPEGEESQPDHAANLMTAGVILVIVLGFGGLAWKFFSNRSAAQANSPSPAPVVVQQQPAPVVQQVSAPAPATDSSSAAHEQPAADSSAADAKKPQPTSTVVPETKDKSQLALTNAPLESTAKKTDIEKALDTKSAEKPVRLNLHMKGESWVSVKTDGKLQWEGVLPAATFRTFKASKEIVVKLGNASGVEVSYNGKPMPPFPSDAKTRTFTISENGVVQQ